MYTIESMKTPRWGNNPNFKPRTITPQELSVVLNNNKGKYLWCECLSQHHLKNNITKLYFDRDVKRKDKNYNENEIQNDYKMCKEKLKSAFGECDWAVCQRHGYNKEKEIYCISWHFVCLDLFIDYTKIPILMMQKGLDNIFDNAVYKSTEQMWQLPWCCKTVKDQRVLTPINYMKDISRHFLQDIQNQNNNNTIIIEEHKRKKMKTSNTQINNVCFFKNKNVKMLQKMLKNTANDELSTWYKSTKQDNGDETHFYKTQNCRVCYVSPNEIHKNNNFVLNIRNNQVYYKCMSKECVGLMPKLLGVIEIQSIVPKINESSYFNQNDLITYRQEINILLSDLKNINKIKQITLSSNQCIIEYFNKYFTGENIDNVKMEFQIWKKSKQVKE